MTTFTSWVQNTYSMIKHLPQGQKHDLKRAQAPVVRGLRDLAAEKPRSPSDVRLYTLHNRTVREHSEARCAAATATSPRTSNRVMTPPSAVSNPRRSDGNRSWLHDHWKPGQVRAGIDFFELKRPTPKPPTQPVTTAVSRHGKTKRAPQPPAQTPVQSPVAKEVTAPTKAFTPPPAPPLDGLKLLQRSDSAPPVPSRPDMSALFAELRGHTLVRSESAPATVGTASEAVVGSSGQPLASTSRVSRTKAPLNAFQRELKSSKRMPEKAQPIEVKPEVQRQAEALRARREALQSAANSISPRRSADSNPSAPDWKRTYLPNGRLLPDKQQRSLVDELKDVQAARLLMTAVANGS